MMYVRSLSCLLLVLAVSLTVGCTESLVGPPDLGEQGEHAYQVLKAAPALSGASVGFAGTTPETVEAFRVLLEEPGADQAFKSLLGRSTKPGELYALAGLYFTDRTYMENAAGEYLQDGSNVETMFGCTVGKQRVSKLTARVVSGSLPRAFRGSRP